MRETVEDMDEIREIPIPVPIPTSGRSPDSAESARS
jgi:hypothetical protein